MQDLTLFKPSPELLAYAAADPDTATCFSVGHKDHTPLAHVFVVKGHEAGTRVLKWLEAEKLSTPNPAADVLPVEGFPSPESAIRTAWENALRNRPPLPPGSLLAEMQAAMIAACADGKAWPDARQIYQFSRRIARRPDPDDVSVGLVEGRQGGLLHLCLGDWEVTNADTELFGDVRMWLNRFLPNTAHNALHGLSTALKNKRTTQACIRYQDTRLRPEHLTLIQKLIWEVNVPRTDWVSVFVEGKRPLGDSSIAMSIFRAVGWPLPCDEKQEVALTPDDEERAWNLFDELPFALRDAAKLALTTPPGTPPTTPA